MQSQTEDPLLRIQREISEVVEREHELRNGYHCVSNGNNRTTSPTYSEENMRDNCITPPDQLNNVSLSPSPPPRIIHRALSTSTLSFNTNALMPKRFATNPEQRGLMQRFIKSKGKLSLPTITTVRDPTAMTWSSHLDPIKMQGATVKLVRKGYVPVEERIQRELREMQSRETELRAHQRKTLATSQPNLLAIIDGSDDSPIESPPSTPKLKGARSFAHLCDADDPLPNGTVSAPSSLRPALSLAKLCDDNLDESEVPSSSQLIAKFESIIQQNRTNGSVNHL